MITPQQSQAIGLVVSAVTAFVVGWLIFAFMAYEWNFYYIGHVLGLLLGIVGGGLAGCLMFFGRKRVVPINKKGIRRFLGGLTDQEYATGNHWVSPVTEIEVGPMPAETFMLKIEGEKIDAQDNAPIFFGISGDGGGPNELQYSIINLARYIPVVTPKEEMRNAYMEEARLFFGQMASAVGAKAVKLLFKQYLMLTTGSPEVLAFQNRLAEATFTRMGNGANGEEKTVEPLYSPSALRAIMANAGNFRSMLAKLGIGNIVAFTPNVRENPETENAAIATQVARSKAETLAITVNNVKNLARDLTKETGAHPDLALTTVAALGGQPGVTISNKTDTFNMKGLPEVAESLGTRLIDALTKK